MDVLRRWARSARRALLGLLTLVIVASSVWAAKPPVETPLLVWFGNAAGDGLRSDGQQGVVVVGGVTKSADYANGTQNVLAILQTSGNFRFGMQADTTVAATRSVCVNFGTQLDSVTTRPLPMSSECVNIAEPMHAYPTGDVAIQNLVLGQQVVKLTRFAWDESGYRWRIGYGTDMNQDGVIDSPSVVVTCTEAAVDGKPCTKWLMTPQATQAPTGTAVLFRFLIIPPSKGKPAPTEGPAEFVANVVMPFSMTFTKQ